MSKLFLRLYLLHFIIPHLDKPVGEVLFIFALSIQFYYLNNMLGENNEISTELHHSVKIAINGLMRILYYSEVDFNSTTDLAEQQIYCNCFQ